MNNNEGLFPDDEKLPKDNIPPNFYLKLLRHLKRKGIYVDSDISDLMFPYFPNRSFKEAWWNMREERINSFLSYLKSNNHIDYHIEKYKIPHRPSDEIRIWAKITPDGHKFYMDNKPNWTLVWTVSGVMVAIITLCFSFFKLDVSVLKKPLQLNKKAPANHSSQKTKEPIPKTLPSDSSHK